MCFYSNAGNANYNCTMAVKLLSAGSWQMVSHSFFILRKSVLNAPEEQQRVF